MNFPHNLEFIEQKYHKNIKQIEEIYNKHPINYKLIKEILENIKDNESEGIKIENILNEQEKNYLESIQYETYIKLDMFVEALEHSGKFQKNTTKFIKSSEYLYEKYYDDLKQREEDI